MIEQDTVRLLRECDAGVKMGLSAIENVIEHVENKNFRRLLEDSRSEHEKIDKEIQTLLEEYGDSGKELNAMARGMAKMKINMKLTAADDDETAADVITDGCNTGVKSLHKYLNKYKAASEKTKDIAKRLTNIEERLSIDIRCYL